MRFSRTITVVGCHAVGISPGKVDRSPCGTGTSARLAVLHVRGWLSVGEPYLSTSLIGSEFRAAIVDTTKVGEAPAVVPRLSGRAWITGLHQYSLDPSDPFPQG
jgi:proline racemase